MRFIFPILPQAFLAAVVLPASLAAPPVVAAEAGDPQAIKTVAEICTTLLDARRAIHSGEMLIVRESRSAFSGKKEERKSMLHVWFDGEKRRVEELHEPWTDRNGRESARNTENTCRGGYSDTTLVWHSDRPVDGKMAVLVTDVDLTDNKGRYRLPNPRLFGLDPSNLHDCDWEKVDFFVGNKARTDESVMQEAYKGEECLKVEYRLPAATPQEVSWAVRFWVSPKQGASVVRMQLDGRFNDNEFVTTLECENQKSADSGIWYPRRLVWESGKIGVDPQQHEEAQVTLVSLNQPIDAPVFSLKAIRSLTPGTFVHRESKERDPNFFNDQTVNIRGRDIHRAIAVWNGEKLVSREEFEESGKLP